jgi:CD109 antigen
LLSRKLPKGCGEQRLVTFVPTIVATKYLAAINKLLPSQKEKSEKFLRMGYHQILERKNSDGSFNLWGYEKSDSIWLTAYILKCLGHVKHFISINPIHVYEAMSFLKSKQSSSGSFSEYGALSNRRIQGGLQDNNNVALSAYVVISFLENSDYESKFQTFIDKALNFIDQNVIQMNENYAVAISAYALVLGKHKAAQSLLVHLKDHAIVEEGLMHWENKVGVQRSKADTSLPLKIEIASYALLAFLKFGDETAALSIMNWLVTNRNSQGGFYSTQDTVIGLQALAEVAKVYYTPNVNMHVKLSYANETKVFEVTDKNDLVLNNFEFPPHVKSFTVNANGTGKALLNIWSSSNINTGITSQVFKLSLNVLAAKNGGTFYLTTCVRYLPNENQNESSMAVMEIALPSGYVYDSDSTSSMKEFNVKVTKQVF